MKRRIRAFTLVELLVVIGIIALLIAMLMPVLNKARQAANNTICLSNLHQIGQAIALYTNQNQGTLPFGWWGGDANGGAADWTTLLTSVLVQGGGNTYADYQENGTPTTPGEVKGAAARTMFTDVDTIQFDRVSRTNWIHYAAHPRLMPAIGTLDWGMPGSPPPLMQVYKITKVRRASEVVLIMDSTQVMGDLQGRAAATAYQIDGHNLDGNWNPGAGSSYLLSSRPTATNGYGASVGPVGPNAGSIVPGPNKDCPGNQFTGTDGEIRWRHFNNHSANFLFVDGHCEGRAYKSPTQCDLLRRNVDVDSLP